MIQRNSSNAMYLQLVELIKREILQRKYIEDSCIGKHTEIAERWKVSLITVRKALKILEEEGYITIKQGKGTFVKPGILKNELNRLTGTTQNILKTNIKPDVKVLSIEKITTPESFSPEIKREMGEKCILAERIHSVDGTVISFARLYLPIEYGEQLSKEELENFTVYQLYQNKLGVQLGKGRQNIRAVPSNVILANMFGVAQGTPLLFIEREAYSKQNQLIEVMELYYDHTQYTFRVELDLSAE